MTIQRDKKKVKQINMQKQKRERKSLCKREREVYLSKGKRAEMGRIKE